MPAWRRPRRPGRARADELVANSGALLGSRLVVAALGWAGTVLMVRTLSTDEFGRFTFVFSFLALVSVLTDLGVGRVVVAGLLGDEGRDRLLGHYVVLRSALGVGGYVLAVGFVVVAGYPADVVQATALAGVVLVLSTVSAAYETAYEAHLRMGPVAVANAVAQLAQLGLVAAIAAGGGSLLLFTLPPVLFEVVALAVKVRRLPGELRPQYGVELAAWRRMLREAAPLAAGNVLEKAYHRIDVVLLSRLDGFDAAASYGIAYRFADLVHFASTALQVLVLPLLVRAWPDDRPAFSRTVQRAFLLSALAGTLALVELGLFAPELLRLLYGPDYVAADLATVLLVAGELAYFFAALAAAVLVASGRTRSYPVAALVGLGANVGLNLWLIPTASFEGAALATFATEVLVAGFLLTVALRVPGMRPLPLAGALKVALAAVPAFAVGTVVAELSHWSLGLVVAPAALLGAAHLLGVGGDGGLRALVLRDEPEPAPAS